MNKFGVFLIFILLGAIIVSMGADAKQFTTAFPLVTNEAQSQADVPIAEPHALTDFPVVAPDAGDNGSATKPTGAHLGKSTGQSASSQPQSPETREDRQKPVSTRSSEKAVKQPAARPGTSTASPTPRPRSTAKERPPKKKKLSTPAPSPRGEKKPAVSQHGGNSPNVCNPQKSPNRMNCNPRYVGGKQQSPDNHRRQY